MANKTIGELTAATTPLDGTELTHIVQSGNSRRTTLAGIVGDLVTPAIGDNLLINPLGTINQREYVSGAATTAAKQYTVDRWRVVTLGESLSWTESENVRTFTAPAGGVEQPVDGADFISGEYTLSWEGTATATINGAGVTNGGQVTLTGGVNAVLRFSGGTFSKPKLEFGSSATAFRPRLSSQEEHLCRRFYLNMDGQMSFVTGSAAAANANRQRLSPSMRDAPSISFAAASGSGGDISVPGNSVVAQAGLHSTDVAITTLRLDAELTA